MGSHYVQQALLRHFEDPAKPDFIWTYIRDEEPRLLPIENVAQSPGFYDAKTEEELNKYVEGPTTPLLDALRRGETLDVDERAMVAMYAATSIKRVPRTRERAKAAAPIVLEQVVERLRAEVPDLAGGDPARIEKLSAELDAAHQKFRAATPAAVLHRANDPRPTHEQVHAIRDMAWRLLVATPPEMFLTSDNPVFYFESLGIGNRESEFAFPLSPKHCLHGCRQPVRDSGLEIRQAERSLVHEINRRMAHNATKMLFANRRAEFPFILLRKGQNHFLSRINWTY